MSGIVIVSNNHILNRIGGAEVQAHLLAKELAHKGWRVFYLSSDIEAETTFGGYDLLPLPHDKVQLYKLLDSLEYDCIYQRGRKKLTHIISKYCKDKKKRFVFAASMDIDCHKRKFTFRNIDSISDVLKHLILFRKNSKIDNDSLNGIRNADVVLTQTEYQQKLMLKNLEIESTIFENVHSLPKLKDITKSTLPVILWLANLKEWKQPELFLKVVQELSNKECIFRMAGRIHSEKYKKQIEETESINHNFKYLGEVSFDESNELIANADIFVNTSKGQEGFPNTFIQAWLRGVPTVSLQFDPDNLIVNKGLGLNADGSYDKLKKGITELIDNTKLRNELSENATSFASKRYSIENRIDTFISLIQ